jgi:peptide/nickel transport system permease protein
MRELGRMPARLRGQVRENWVARHLGLSFALLVLGVFILGAIFAPWLAPHNPVIADPTASLVPPGSPGHLLGTDSIGHDILSQLMYAPRIDLVVPVVATVVSFAIGVPIGAWIGFYSDRQGFLGLASGQLMRAVDILQAFPVFVLALVLVATLGRSEINVVYALVVLETPVFLRLTRSSVGSVRQRTFVEAARTAGTSEIRIILGHVMPNAIGPALINASVLTGSGILITAGLSFVGAGVPPPTPEWGLMVSEGSENIITGQWWVTVFPGICIGLAVFSLALVGGWLTELLDPRRRSW